MSKINSYCEAFRMIFKVILKPEKYITLQELESALSGDEDEEINLSGFKKEIKTLIESAESIKKKYSDEAYELYQSAVELIDERLADCKYEEMEQEIEILLDSLNDYTRCSANGLMLLDTQALEKRLAFINLGFKYCLQNLKDMEDAYPDDCNFSICESKVMFLKKLNRENECYEIVREILSFDPEPYEYKHLSAIAQSSEFKQWLKNAPIVLTDDERDFLIKSQRVLQNIPHSVIPDGVDKTNTQIHHEVLSLNQAVEKFDFISVCGGGNPKILIIYGDYYCNEAIDDDWLKRQAEKFGITDAKDIEGVLFVDNLYVNTCIEDNESLFLQVMKNVYVDDYVMSCDGVIVFKGDAHIKYGIYGEYNDGYLEVDGKLFTAYLLASDHAMPRSAAQESIYIEGGNGCGINYIDIGKSDDGDYGWGWKYYKASYRLFKPDVWDEDDEFSVDNFFGLIKKGINPFIDFVE